jgi:hypothetical protein
MRRVKKAFLLPLRSVARHANHLELYYWSELKLYELRTLGVMPRWYYRWLYNTCLWLVEFRRFRRLADRAIHTIPLNIRFEVAC